MRLEDRLFGWFRERGSARRHWPSLDQKSKGEQRNEKRNIEIVSTHSKGAAKSEPDYSGSRKKSGCIRTASARSQGQGTGADMKRRRPDPGHKNRDLAET